MPSPSPSIPEIVLVNAHDGTSAYQLRAGLFRPLCTNGLIARIGDFGFISVPHRASVVADVVEGALRLTAQFQALGEEDGGIVPNTCVRCHTATGLPMFIANGGSTIAPPARKAAATSTDSAISWSDAPCSLALFACSSMQ